MSARLRPFSASRRQFLQVSASAAGGLVVSLCVPECDAADEARATGVPTGRGPRPERIGAFVRIESDGRIVIGARGCEIGQGVRTSLPMLIAEELDVPWSMVTVEQLPYGTQYGPQGAGGSTSIPDGWKDLRQAGARARWLLVQAAAARWGLSTAELRTQGGQVLDPNGHKLSYGELAMQAAKLPPPATDVPLKDKKSWRIIGRPTAVVDARDIVTGRATYGIDAMAPGVLTALIARCPYFDGDIARLDDSRALKVPGVKRIVRIPGPRPGAIDRNLAAGVAVVGEDFWSALRGREALEIVWTPPDLLDSTAALEQRAHAALTGQGRMARQDGDFAAARRAAARVVQATYLEPFLAHATMEPPGALIDIKDNRALLIASLQSPGGASRLINAITGIPRSNIEIRLPRAGGGFGRRLENDFVAEAALVAQAIGRPVKVIWTREDDLQNDFYRPFGVHELTATLDAGGRLTGWAHRVAATSRKYRAEGMEEDPDWVGCADPDGIPAGCVSNYVSEFLPVDFNLARGWLRGPLPTFSAFPVESFMDEVAAASGRDPVAFRLAVFGEPRELDYRDHGGPKVSTARLAEVLRRAAREIGYGRSLARGSGIGIASHFTFGGYVAHAFEVALAGQGELKVTRCVCVADIGQPINPRGIEAQLMGGTIDGLSTALNLQITVKDGRVEQSNFPHYPLLRMAAAPDVEMHIIDSPYPPVGAGEMGVPTVAPALANAIFAASGRRIRRLPLSPQLKQEPPV